MEKLRSSDECFENPMNEMGINASPLSQGTFYLTTQNANQFPFCR
jgi:hypothetical protein